MVGVTTAQGTILKGCSTRKAENHCTNGLLLYDSMFKSGVSPSNLGSPDKPCSCSENELVPGVAQRQEHKGLGCS